MIINSFLSTSMSTSFFFSKLLLYIATFTSGNGAEPIELFCPITRYNLFNHKEIINQLRISFNFFKKIKLLKKCEHHVKFAHHIIFLYIFFRKIFLISFEIFVKKIQLLKQKKKNEPLYNICTSYKSSSRRFFF